jgi:hypothetical protein
MNNNKVLKPLKVGLVALALSAASSTSFAYALTGFDWGGPGAEVTWSIDTVGMDCSAFDGSSCSGLNPMFAPEIARAFDTWSAVADITFTEVVDQGEALIGRPQGLFNRIQDSGDIRFSFIDNYDGVSGVLAMSLSTDPAGAPAHGDILFDSVENWTTHGLGVGIDIFSIALHEIGHSIGLEHVAGGIMNPTFNPSNPYTGLTADDIAGVQAIYGVAEGWVEPSEVPVPAAAWLFGSALMGLAGVKRKAVTA